MSQIRRFGTALLIAAMLGSGAVSLEASKGGGGKKVSDAQAALCSYLNSIITYPYVGEYVLAAALYSWDQAGCSALQ
jgi:hypothetical protein